MCDVDLQSDQWFFLEALGSNARHAFRGKPWEDIRAAVGQFWASSAYGEGIPWPQVEAVARQAWLRAGFFEELGTVAAVGSMPDRHA